MACHSPRLRTVGANMRNKTARHCRTILLWPSIKENIHPGRRPGLTFSMPQAPRNKIAARSRLPISVPKNKRPTPKRRGVSRRKPITRQVYLPQLHQSQRRCVVCSRNSARNTVTRTWLPRRWSAIATRSITLARIYSPCQSKRSHPCT